MQGDARDEIAGGSTRRPRPPLAGRVAWSAVAVVALVSAGLAAPSLLDPGTPESGRAPAPVVPTTAPADPAPAPATSTPPAVDPPRLPRAAGSPVSVEAVCTVGTDHTRQLAVRFLMTNETAADLTVLSVRPVLPLGGLRTVGISVVRGDCYRWLPGGPDDVVPPGDSRAVTMRFLLPRTCPWPLPVQARVRVRGPDGTRGQTLRVLSDLGGTDFESCPTAAPAG